MAFRCPYCNHEFTADEMTAGRQVPRCAGCSREFRPPLPPEADEVRHCAAQFHACPLLVRRRQILLGFAGSVFLLVFLSVLLRLPLLAGAALGMLLLTSAGYLAVAGCRDNTYFFQKLRELAIGTGWRDWLVGLGAGIIVFLALWVFGLLWIWLLLLFVAGAAAAAFHRFVDHRIAAWRTEPLRQCREILDRLRRAGHDEAAIHGVVARAGGEPWEEFFEALFGYEALVAARPLWTRGDDGRDRPRFRPWRDPIVRWILDRLRIRREADELRRLEQQLEQALLAEGVPASIARQRAGSQARIMTEHPGLVAQGYALQPLAGDKRDTQYQALMATMEAAEEEEVSPPTAWERIWGVVETPLAVLFGQRARFLAGCALMAGCLIWAHQNALLRQPSEDEWNKTLGKLEELGTAVQQTDAQGVLAKSERLAVERTGQSKPLELPPLPAPLTAVFDSFNPGVAGLVLILAAFLSGLRISLFVFPAAAVMLLAHKIGIPGLVPAMGNSLISLAIGMIVAVAGFVVGRTAGT